MRVRMKSVVPVLGIACVLWSSAAAAETYTLELSGDPAALVPFSFTSADSRFDIGTLALDGLPEPIFALAGDEITAVVSIIDGPLQVAASPNQVVGVDFHGPFDPQFDDSPGAAGGFDGRIAFYLGDQIVRSSPGGSCSNCAFAAVFQTPGDAFAFDRIEVSGQFDNLTAPYTIDSVNFYYQLKQPIPEPATWALWLAGLGVAGVVARRRTKPPAA